MTDSMTAAPGATLKLSEKTINALRDTWRAAGGVTYSAPKGQMAAMAEPKLFAFLSEFLLSADRTVVDRGAPAADDLSQRLDRTEHALFQLVKAICPGLAHNDLLADAEYALAAMGSAAPAAFFGIDDTPLDDGSPRYLQILAEHQADDDVFQLYRRAPTVAELQAHIDQHLVTEASNPLSGANAAAKKATTAAPAAKKASTK